MKWNKILTRQPEHGQKVILQTRLMSDIYMEAVYDEAKTEFVTTETGLCIPLIKCIRWSESEIPKNFFFHFVK